LIQSFELGNAIKNGVPVAIVGAPNTGKKYAFEPTFRRRTRHCEQHCWNHTRDVIEETLNIEGILFRLIDTAGIRESSDEIESLGIERSHEKIRQAKIVLVLHDSKLDSRETEAWFAQLKEEFSRQTLCISFQ
jgi:tRNA modification GTPase